MLSLLLTPVRLALSKVTQDDYNKSLLALTLWREARGEGQEGMQAVGNVIRNRTVNGNWAQVMEAKWQFSSLTAPGDLELVAWPQPADASWQSAMAIAEGVYSGTLPDVTGGATHYFATTIPTPSWANKMTFTVQIGKQRFFK